MEQEAIGWKPRIEGYLKSDISACLRQNEEYYLNVFKDRASRHTFHYCAAIFQNNWFAYRKMWREWTAIIIGEILLYSVMFLLTPLNNLDVFKFMISMETWIIYFIRFVVLGCFGNRIYWRRLKKSMDAYGCQNRPGVDNIELHKSLLKLNGTSLIAIVLSVLATRVIAEIMARILVAIVIGW